MHSIWLAGWGISAVLFVGALRIARRAGLKWIDAGLYSTLFFPCPLFFLLGGRNSFIYVFDFATPIAVWLACRRWRRVSPIARRAAAMLFIAIGLVPAVIGLWFGTSQDALFALVVLSRSAGVAGMLCVMSAARRDPGVKPQAMIVAFSWMGGVLAIAMILQGLGLFHSDVFYAVDQSLANLDLQYRYIVAGMFRGSLGIAGMLAVIACVSQIGARRPRGFWLVAFPGAIGGLIVILLSGSKTSLICVPVALVGQLTLSSTWARRSGARFVGVLAIASVLIIPVLSQVNNPYLERTFGVFSGRNSSFQTLDIRETRWRDVWGKLKDSPQVLVGQQEDSGLPLNVAFYHNEYLGVLSVTGIVGSVCYLVSLLLLGFWLWRFAKDIDRDESRFAFLVFVCGAVQGADVGHLNPGLFFVTSVGSFTAIYGIGLGAARPRKQRPELGRCSTAHAQAIAAVK